MKTACNRFATLYVLCLMIMFNCEKGPQAPDTSALFVDAVYNGDKDLALRDTLHVSLSVEGAPERNFRYCLQKEGCWNIDTIDYADYRTTWDFPDTGLRRIAVWAIDDEGRRTHCDTIVVTVSASAPRVILHGNDMGSANDTTVILLDVDDSDGVVDHFEWRIDNRDNGVIFSWSDTFRVVWTIKDTGNRVLSVTAVDNDGLRSTPDSIKILVTGSRPGFVLEADTQISINDTLFIRFVGTDDDGVITEYQWTEELPADRWKSSDKDTVMQVWRLPDTGRQVFYARIVDNDGLVSAPESIFVFVTAERPRLSVNASPHVSAGDSVRITAHASDPDGSVVCYRWLIHTSAGVDVVSTPDSTILMAWGADDTGSHTVSVVAIDDDSLSSEIAVCTLRVHNGSVVPVADTILSSRDTLLVSRVAIGSDEPLMYYWDIDGNGWDDSCTGGQYRVFYSGLESVSLVCRVRFSNGLPFQDTINIYFNRPPDGNVLLPFMHDTLWIGMNSMPGEVDFSTPFTDPDNDPINGIITWGRTGIDTFEISDSVHLPVDSVGQYQWRLVLRDSFGNEVVRSGVTVAGKEWTICFAGHSLVTGYGGDNASGGFRAGVVSGLRDSLAPLERIRPVGPFVSEGLMAGSVADDSCFAISGAFAREMLLLLDHAYKDLTADIWVLMLGVNGSFSAIEMTSTTLIMERIFERNPHARLYVLLSPPYASLGSAQRRYYNNNVTNKITATETGLIARGFAASVVRADTALWSTADTFSVEPTLYNSDMLHPNQDGYDRLSDEILAVMRESVPGVLAMKFDDLR